jgi:hypothetical protein
MAWAQVPWLVLLAQALLHQLPVASDLVVDTEVNTLVDHQAPTLYLQVSEPLLDLTHRSTPISVHQEVLTLQVLLIAVLLKPLSNLQVMDLLLLDHQTISIPSRVKVTHSPFSLLVLETCR